MYKDLAGVFTRLTGNITHKTQYLPVPPEDHAFLLEHLADGDYSFLELRDGNAVEYVKVINICGKIVIERGAIGTKALAFRCGSGVSFQLTMQGVQATVCQMEDCDAI